MPAGPQDEGRKSAKGGDMTIDRDGGKMPIVSGVLDEGLEVRFLESCNKRPGFFELTAIECSEGTQGVGIGRNGCLGAAATVEIVFKSGQGFLPALRRRVFQWNFFRIECFGWIFGHTLPLSAAYRGSKGG